MNQNHGRRLGALGGLLAAALTATALAVALAGRTAADLPDGGAVRVEDLVGMLVTGTGAAVSAWLALSATVTLLCAVARMAGSRWRAGEAAVHRLAPTIVRRALAVTITAGLGLGVATGAQAATLHETHPPSVSGLATTTDVDLGWAPTTSSTVPVDTTWQPTVASPAGATTVPVPAAAVTQTAATTPAPVAPTAPDAQAGPAGGSVVVQPGDSLWDIAARHLPPDASDAQIAAAWPRWYEANRDTIGDDPDLLRPAQLLRAPGATPDSPTTPAPTEVTR
ncbi:LysM peptidoglycan-binding domain-containing protein [Cellulomonas soli]